MGYSASSKAFRAMDRLMDIKRRETGSAGSNYWEVDGIVTMFEVGRENKDGAMTGTVLRSVSKNNNGVKRLGSFRIEPDGTISRFPGLTKKEIDTLNAFNDGAMFVAV